MSEDRGILGSGGPPPSQFLQALISINTALIGQASALNSLLAVVLPTPLPSLTFSEISAPAPPASGAILYVDIADHRLKVMRPGGVITILT